MVKVVTQVRPATQKSDPECQEKSCLRGLSRLFFCFCAAFNLGDPYSRMCELSHVDRGRWWHVRVSSQHEIAIPRNKSREDERCVYNEVATRHLFAACLALAPYRQ